MFNHNMSHLFMILIKLKRNKLKLMTNCSKPSILLINKRKSLLPKNKSLLLPPSRLTMLKPLMMLLTKNTISQFLTEISLKTDTEMLKVNLRLLKKI